VTRWLSGIGQQWEAWLDAAAGHPTGRWRAGWRAGYVTALAHVADTGQLRDQLRVAMNETYAEEYPDGFAAPLGPYGEDDSPDHRRLTIIAGKLAATILASLPPAPDEENPQ
jgi:hypothetical protein